MNNLEKAIQVAVEAHSGDTDKAGATYIRHPLRLMQQMDTETERVVAVLHDVVEDTPYDLGDIEEKFDAEIRDAVDAVTKREEEDYEEMIDRAAANPIGRPVKIADLEDNMDITRLDSADAALAERLEKYHQSWKKLKSIEA